MVWHKLKLNETKSPHLRNTWIAFLWPKCQYYCHTSCIKQIKLLLILSKPKLSSWQETTMLIKKWVYQTPSDWWRLLWMPPYSIGIPASLGWICLNADDNFLGQGAGWTVFGHFFTDFSHPELVKILLKNKVDHKLCRNSDGATPVWIAAHLGHLEVIKTFTKALKKADLKYFDKVFET